MNPLLEALRSLLEPIVRDAVRLEVRAALESAADTRNPTLTPKEVALEYGVDDAVIRALINDSKLRNVGNSRRFLVLRHQVEAHLGITQQLAK